MISIRITRERVAKEHCYQGNKGTYLDMVLFDNKDGKDQYGNDGFVVQSVSKEARQQGVKGPIIGNWKRVGEDAPKPKAAAPAPAPKAASKPDEEGDDVPF
jgi:hypothetical protein